MLRFLLRFSCSLSELYTKPAPNTIQRTSHPPLHAPALNPSSCNLITNFLHFPVICDFHYHRISNKILNRVDLHHTCGMPFTCLYKCRDHVLPQHKLLISPFLRSMQMEGSFGEVPEIVEQFFEQDHRHDPSFRLPLVPWSDGAFLAPQFGYDGYSCLNESDAVPAMPSMDCSMEGCQIPEPAIISSTSAFGDLAHFINDDASSNEIEEYSCMNLPQIVPVPLCDQMLKTTRKHAQVSSNVSTKMQAERSATSKRGQKRAMSFVQGDSNNADNSINSCSYISEDQEEPSSNPQSIYARKRRERINERLRILQNLVPNGTKVDISTMLEEAAHYVKFLQLQIKLLSSDELWMYAPIYNGVNIGLDLKISPLQKK